VSTLGNQAMNNQAIDNQSEQLHQFNGANQQYLTFELCEELYGVDVLSVQQIKGWEQVRSIPDMPDYISGVIDLRGVIVPIMDLRLRFDMEKMEYSATTVVIILATHFGDDVIPLGIVVDAVSDVVNVGSEGMKGSPNIGNESRTRFMQGMINHGEEMVIVLNLEKLLSDKTCEKLQHVDG